MNASLSKQRVARIVALANQKGGVGKSTTTAHLARAAQRKGYRVLIVDADPQGNVTSALIATPLERDENKEVVQLTIADVLMPRPAATMREVIVPTIYAATDKYPGVDLVPSATQLSIVEEMLVPQHDRELILRKRLAQVAGDYDLILIDCPPSLGQLTVNALTAAEFVMVISQAEVWSTDGIDAIRKTIRHVQGRVNPTLDYVGVLISMWDQGTEEVGQSLRNKAALADIAKNFPEAPILRPFIPRRVKIGQAVEEGTPLDQVPALGIQVIAADYGTHVQTIMDKPRKELTP
ncbi:ParA family protein [Pseudonocardiaceae bacterium YIM PH 21723]|nr:ParA family protein [Pseudonocardiaceae bacterium YIM PH 21723]